MQCPEVLVFVQYLLSLQGSKELSLKLLYLLPALATHKVGGQLFDCVHIYVYVYTIHTMKQDI